MIVWVSILLKLAMLALAASTDLESRIENGEPLGPEHKHLVELSASFYSQTGMVTLKCTGSILNQRWLITARHCVYEEGKQLIGAYVVRHMYDKLPIPIIGVDIRIPEVEAQRTPQNDIALIKLAKPITLNDGVHQAIALDVNYPIDGSKAVVAGYGKPEPNLPRQGTVVLRYCAGGLCSLSNEFMAWPDHGDSGGPVTCNGKLVGIVSQGLLVPGYPPTHEVDYAAIAYHYNWIMNVIHT